MKPFRPLARPVSLAAFLLLAAGSIAQAATITVDERSLRTSGSIGSSTSYQSWSREEFPPANAQVFNKVVDETRTAGTNLAHGMASMESSVAPSLIIAIGSSSSEVSVQESTRNNYASQDSSSRLRITFQILQPTMFTLTGVLAFDNVLGSNYGGSILSLRTDYYSGPSFNLNFGNSSSSSDFRQNVQLTGMLDPNTYTLEAIASTSAQGYSIGSRQLSNATFAVQLALGAQTSPVPLPASAWMLLTGLAAIGGRALGRKRAA